MTEKFPFVKRLEDIETMMALIEDDIEAKKTVMSVKAFLKNPQYQSEQSVLYRKTPPASEIDWEGIQEVLPLQISHLLFANLRLLILNHPFNTTLLSLDEIHLQLRSLSTTQHYLKMKAEQLLISRAQENFFDLLQPSDEIQLKAYSRQEAKELGIIRKIINEENSIYYYSLSTTLKKVYFQGNFKPSIQIPRLFLIAEPL